MSETAVPHRAAPERLALADGRAIRLSLVQSGPLNLERDALT